MINFAAIKILSKTLHIQIWKFYILFKDFLEQKDVWKNHIINMFFQSLILKRLLPLLIVQEIVQ